MPDSLNGLRIPPHSEEAERGVLGSILLDPPCLDRVDLKPDDFYDSRHQALFSQMVEMSQSGKAMDAITIGQWLRDHNALDKIGGYDYLGDLQDSAIVSAHVESYAGDVAKAAQRRLEIDVLSDGLEVAYRGESASEGVLGRLIGLSGDSSTDQPLDVLGNQFIDDCKKGNVGNFRWWCDDWTYKMGKMDSELMIFHAPRSTGKTALMLQWITEAHKVDQVVPLASIEMLRKELVPRMISNIGQVSTFTMKTRGSVTYDEERKSAEAVSKIRGLNFVIRDKGMSIDDIFKWAIAESRKQEIHAVFVDNLLSINDGGVQYQSKTIMYDAFIRRFRDLRDTLKIPVIILAHPNKEGGVAWSTDVENFADVILYLQEVPEEGFVLKPSGRQVNKRHDIEGKHIMARFQKCRQGIMPIAHLDFIGSTQTFKHLGWEE